MGALTDAWKELTEAMEKEENPFTKMRLKREAEAALCPYAESLGFTYNPPDRISGQSYVKGNVVLWPILAGWMCADLVPCTDPEFPEARQYVNHRPYTDLKTALDTEGVK